MWPGVRSVFDGFGHRFPLKIPLKTMEEHKFLMSTGGWSLYPHPSYPSYPILSARREAQRSLAELLSTSGESETKALGEHVGTCFANETSRGKAQEFIGRIRVSWLFFVLKQSNPLIVVDSQDVFDWLEKRFPSRALVLQLSCSVAMPWLVWRCTGLDTVTCGKWPACCIPIVLYQDLSISTGAEQAWRSVDKGPCRHVGDMFWGAAISPERCQIVPFARAAPWPRNG